MLEEFLRYGFQVLSTALVTGVFFLIQRAVKKSDERRQDAEKQRQKDTAKETAALHSKLDAQSDELRGMAQSMECFQKAQHACQLENAKEFATKEDVAQVRATVDQHTADIAYLKGRDN